MKAYIESLRYLLPLTQHPLVLIAFTFFLTLVVLFRLLAAKVPRLRENSGFRLINRFITWSFIIVFTVVILGFATHLYALYQQGGARSRSRFAVRGEIADLLSVVDTISREPSSRTESERIQIVGPLIYKIGERLDPGVAIELIAELRSHLRASEISPVFLAISSTTLSNLFSFPFNFLPEHERAAAGRFSGSTWSYPSNDNEGLYSQSLASQGASYEHNDLLRFLRADWADCLQCFEGSSLKDAAWYATIRSSWVQGNDDRVVKCGNRFLELFPNHRHSDDAASYIVRALEEQGDIPGALRMTMRGLALPDGDMQGWFEWESLQCVERYAGVSDLNLAIAAPDLSALRPMLRYARAQANAIREHYQEAVSELDDLYTTAATEPVCIGRGARLNCLSSAELLSDIVKFSAAIPLERQDDLTAEGLFHVALDISYDELFYYDRLLRGARRGIRERESGFATTYYLERNNYVRASALLDVALNRTDRVALKQAILYKLGRWHEHLAWASSFLPRGERGARLRREYAVQSVREFGECASMDKEGDLADDCRAEEGLQAWLLLGDKARAESILRSIPDEFAECNAVDDALAWLARMQEESGRTVDAMTTWAELLLVAQKDGWRREAIQRSEALRTRR